MRSLCVLLSGTALAVCASCTDVRLARYRDERLLNQYHYALGEQYVDVGGLRLCYQEQGVGEPVLILPGLGTSIDFWQLNAPVLAERFHVLALDLPGFGKSDKPDASYDLAEICERIVAFLDAKGLQRVSIIGGSMGGHIGLLLALSHPERVDKLVMMGSTGDWPSPGPLLNLALTALWNDTLVTDYFRSAWPGIYARMSLRQTPMTQRLFRYQMANRVDARRFAAEGRAAARALHSIFYSSCRDRLGEVQAEVLLIWGEADHIHGVDDARYFHEHLPHSQLVIVPQAAHEVMIDQPEVFNRIVAAFLHGGDGEFEASGSKIASQRPAG
jgi:pimeloyl-ACP methyl ester carboxylesterase